MFHLLFDDFFDFFRYVLGTVATIYAVIVTWQSLYSWYVWLAGSDRYVGVLRRYLILHGLRLRFKTFWGDVIISLLLCVVFCILWRAHTLVNETSASLHDTSRYAQIHRR